MNIVLLSQRLSFCRLATGTIHAHDAKWGYTMCGKAVSPVTQMLSYRTLSDANVCKLCIKSLHTYTGGPARLNATPLVRFEQSEVGE